MDKAVRGLGTRYPVAPPERDCSCWSVSHVPPFHLTADRLAFSFDAIEP